MSIRCSYSRLSMGAIVGLVIGLMGLLGLALALLSGVVHRDLATGNHRSSLTNLIRIKADDVIADLASITRDLGAQLQTDPALRAALQHRDQARLTQLLNNQFHQYFVTASVVQLENLTIYNPRFDAIARSTEKSDLRHVTGAVCPDLIDHARQRVGAAKIKPVTALCLVDGRPMSVTLFAIGGLRVSGYIEITVEPANNMKAIEQALGMPIRIAAPGGETLYQSPDWPDTKNSNKFFFASYKRYIKPDEPVLDITVAENFSSLGHQLARARWLVLLLSGGATLIVALIALWILRGAALKPIGVLATQIRRIRSNREFLKETIDPRGAKEISALGRDFNEVTAELKKLYDTLEQMAFTDPLTRLPNRNLLHNYMDDFTGAFTDTRSRLAFFLMDLDRFKYVNDTLGHDVGDKLLTEVGIRLRDVLRGSDIVARVNSGSAGEIDKDMVARLGGDEFAVVLPNISRTEDAVAVARKITHAMEQPFTHGQHVFTIGVSIGIAMYPEHGTDKSTLMRHADLAMYHAKKSRSRFAFYEPRHEKVSLSNFVLEGSLARALEARELTMFYQPQISLDSRTLVGAEALVRWIHPERGMILPDEFIPLAEQTGHIHQLTNYVLNEVLQQFAQWNDAGFRGTLSVNLSAVNLQNPDLLDNVWRALDRWSVPPKRLILELTESAVMTDPAHALHVVNQLNEIGVQLAVDDFGTGYSSLAYLKKLPVRELKIDRTFVADMEEDSDDNAIVHASVRLAHELGLSVVAEGVESATILSQLAELGCDRAQGYYIAKPMPADEFESWIKEIRFTPARRETHRP